MGMKRWLLVLIPLFILIGLIGWRFNLKKTEAAEQAQQRAARGKMPPLVSVAEATTRDIVQTFEAVGSVEAPFNVRIAPKVTDLIEHLEVREGDRVKRGQVLVRINPAEVEAQIRQRQAALAEAQSRLAQAQIGQAPTNVGVATQIRQQEAALASAQAEHNQTRERVAAEQSAAAADISDAQGRIDSANAAIANAEAAIRSAQANLDNARAKFNRIHDLYQQGFIAAQEVDDARTTVQVQEGALEVARSQKSAAVAQRNSAQAQKQSAEKQAEVIRARGRADLAAALAKVQQAQAALDLARANTAQKPAYQQNVAALRSAVDAARAALRSAINRRADTLLVSPIDGYVTARFADPGAMATPGQPILTVQAIRQVWVTVSVLEEVSREIHLGQTAQVRLDALPGQTFTGRITQINPSADPQSRQFSVRISLDNSKNLLKPGMYARVTLTTRRLPRVVAIPREAVQQGPDGPAVTVVGEDGVARRRPVVLGASDPDGYAVKKGLRPGEKVVILSAAPVRDGTTVRVAEEQPDTDRASSPSR